MSSATSPQPQAGIITRSSLIVIFLASVMFPRVLTALKVPSVVNFLHFALVIVLFVWVVPKIRSQIAGKLLVGLMIFLGIIISSAMFNKAGVINVILSFLMLAEPFMMLIAIVSTKVPESSIKKFQFWIFSFVYIHLAFVYFQKFIINPYSPDEIKGIFLKMGAGHHVGGDVALTFGVYFLLCSGVRSLWLRIFVFILCMGNILYADVKQVVIAFLVSWFLLILTQMKEIVKAIMYLGIAIPITIGVLKIINTLYSGIRYISDMEVVTEAFQYKLSVFSIISSFYKSDINWLFGLGPGHTISRLGWLMKDYLQLLQPLGITGTSVFETVFNAQESYYWSNSITGSSMYSLLFSWAGIWGDLGFLGLGVYLYLWFLVWNYICLDKVSKFFLITVFVAGLIFSWMEEPAFMLFVASLIGLQWQKHQAEKSNKLWQHKMQDNFFVQKPLGEKA
ncbi:hypothetical protein H6G81_12570 [Scytonema hofmannii FACHB-248]|uniref:O-antigen polymerase n=1 Tax=Scytonema hofmannii FACHB-248 TaxID=1842502 RepID=A0ABR8GQ46_9CYAN|nr:MULTISPECIES: hypothetical protein [Nostocales]MBD2605347.1 hypothetical protein [Scytonema hofmannii FACHB-248]